MTENLQEYQDIKCHSCFESNSKRSLISIMLGMTVCFSTLWRFPYQTVNFGGAWYIAIYLVLAALFVYPALTAEWGLGRLTGRGPDGAYKNIKLPGHKYISVVLFGIVLAIASYFAIWIGWIVRYIWSSLTDPNLALSSTSSASYFDSEVAANPWVQLFFAGLVVLLVSPVVLGGEKRIQKVSNIVVPIFYTFVIAMTAFVLIQPGVFQSTIQYLTDFNTSNVTSYTFITALGQAFFSLCLGGTFMVLYGSYMDRKSTHNIPVNAGMTVFGNSLASIISVFLIIGILSFGGLSGDLSQFGPGLFFGVIPEAFQALSPGGDGGVLISLGMAIFFIMFLFAAYLPMTAIFEVLTVGLVDQFDISRKQAFSMVAVTTLVLAVPSAMSPHSGGFLYNLDVFIGALGLIFGSMIAIFSFTWLVPRNTVLDEVNQESEVKLGSKWYFWTKYVTPVFMLLIVLYVLSDVLARTVTGLFDVRASDYLLYERIVRITPWVTILLVGISVGLYLLDRERTSTPISS